METLKKKGISKEENLKMALKLFLKRLGFPRTQPIPVQTLSKKLPKCQEGVCPNHPLALGMEL